MKIHIICFILLNFIFIGNASSPVLKKIFQNYNLNDDIKEYKEDQHHGNSATYDIPKEYFGQPEQIHISYGLTPDQMMITWVTQDIVGDSVVEYGPSSISMTQTGNSSVFTDGGIEKRKMEIHRVLLTGLTPGQTYIYHCGSPIYGWSPLFAFTAMRNDSSFAPRFAIYGDMGNVNPQSMARLQEDTARGMYDFILHVGDFAYDMDSDNARIGDAFMNQIESIAAYLPYMTCPGNHENAYNFSNYVNKFSMPSKDGSFGGDANHFYSTNIGPIHLIGMSTEFYYFLEYGIRQVVNQYNWLEKDLIEANKPENRAKHPWIIVMGHRPMYCTNNDDDDCTKFDDRVRSGFPFVHTYGLEDMFYKYGVDFEFWAHEHSYERLWPIYDYTVYNGSYDAPYTNPKAPIHLVTGSAGCKEEHDGFGQLRNYTAFRSDDYGYTRMTVFNSSHVYFEQVSDDKDGQIIDSVWVIKDKHGSYTNSV